MGGRTWTSLESMKQGIGTAKPRAVLMGSRGPLVLVGGRPGNKVWVNPGGMGGDNWYEQDVPGALGNCSNSNGRKRMTTSYNGIAALTPVTEAISVDCSDKIYAVPFRLNVSM